MQHGKEMPCGGADGRHRETPGERPGGPDAQQKLSGASVVYQGHRTTESMVFFCWVLLERKMGNSRIKEHFRQRPCTEYGISYL